MVKKLQAQEKLFLEFFMQLHKAEVGSTISKVIFLEKYVRGSAL